MTNNYFSWAIKSLQAMTFIGLSLASITLVVLFAVPHFMESLELREQAENLDPQITQLAQKINTLKSLKDQNLENRVTVLMKNLPAEHDLPYLLSAVKQLSEEYDIKIADADARLDQNRNSSLISSVKGLQTQKVDITISGNSDNLTKFLDNIQVITPIMIIENYDFTNASEQNDSSKIDITIESYSFPKTDPEELKNASEITPPKFTAQEEQLYEELANRKTYEFIPVFIPGENERLNPF